MTRDEIYDHLAKVYLGKRENVEIVQTKKPQPPSWLLINGVITAFILVSVIWGLTAFLTQRDDLLKSRIIYTLNNSPIRLSYEVGGEFPQVKQLSIAVPPVDVAKYKQINVSLRGEKNGNPGMVKIVLTNGKDEKASYYLQGVKPRWQDYAINMDHLNITDWKTLKDVSFVIEAWNVESRSGTILIDNISFSN